MLHELLALYFGLIKGDRKMQIVKSIIIAAVVLLLLDGLWIGVIAKQLYMSQIGSFLRVENGNIMPNFFAAAVVYAALIAGILIFVIPKSGDNVWAALGWGALFGLICYGIYDFTNISVMNKWPVLICFVDVVWGSVLCGITSLIVMWCK